LCDDILKASENAVSFIWGTQGAFRFLIRSRFCG